MDTVDEALAQADWADTFRRLSLYAKRRLGVSMPFQEAEDIAAEAIRQVFDPAYRAWTPQRETLLWHLQSNVNGLIANRRRKKSLTHEQLHDDLSSSYASPDELAVTPTLEQELSRLSGYAQEIGDKLASSVIALALAGTVSPKEVALVLGVPAQKVYDARQRLKRYGAELRRMDGEHI
jgi:hypothetical protein